MSSARAILASSRNRSLLRERRAGNTLRSVYRIDDAFVAKKFEFPCTARRVRRPWIAEDAALKRLAGHGAPRSLGWFEESAGEHRVVWLVKEYVPGAPVERFTPADLPAAARLLAAIHSRGVITDDAGPGNFIRTPDGEMKFLDFGRARIFRAGGLRLDLYIGWELAKLRRESFLWAESLWQPFLPLYCVALAACPRRRTLIRAACAVSVVLRMTRKTLQGKSPRS